MKAASTLELFWRSFNSQTLYEARRLLESSLSSDPDYVRALAAPVDGDYLTPTSLDRAHQLARKAVQADPNLPQAHAQLGWVLSRRTEHDLAVSKKGVALNPKFTDHRFGAALVYVGKPRKALQVLASHMRLDPFMRRSRRPFWGWHNTC